MVKAVTGVIQRGEKYYIGKCLEIDVVTQGETIDETLSNLKEAVALYFEGEPLQNIPAKEPPLLVTIGVEEYASP
jgi:predicted RNase H-like HicB family nuclease